MRRRVFKLESLLEHLSERLGKGQTHSGEENCDRVHTLANTESDPLTEKTNLAEEQGSNQGARLDGQQEDPGYDQQDSALLVENKGRNLYISNTFWTSLSDEVRYLSRLNARY
jgi:hypothetical protein